MPKTTPKTKLTVNHDSISIKTPEWRFTWSRRGAKMSGRGANGETFQKLYEFINAHSGTLGESMKDLSEQWEDVVQGGV